MNETDLLVLLKYNKCYPVGFFPMYFFTEFSDKNTGITIAWTCDLLDKRQGCYHNAIKTHVRDMIFKLSPIHALVIYQIL